MMAMNLMPVWPMLAEGFGPLGGASFVGGSGCECGYRSPFTYGRMGQSRCQNAVSAVTHCLRPVQGGEGNE